MISQDTSSPPLSWLADKVDQALRIRQDSELLERLGTWLCELHQGHGHSLGQPHGGMSGHAADLPCYPLQTASGPCELRIHAAENRSDTALAMAQTLVRICQSWLDQMQAMAGHDKADGLSPPAADAHEQAFLRALEEGLTHAAMSESPMACLLLELADGCPDPLLHQQQTRRMRNSLRKHDALFELSAGRWGLLLHRMGRSEAVHAVVHRLQQDLVPSAEGVLPPLQYGMGLYPMDGRTPSDLLRKARADVQHTPADVQLPAGDRTAPSPHTHSFNPARSPSWH